MSDLSGTLLDVVVVVLALVVGLLLSVATGGRLARLRQLTLARWWLLAIAVAAEVVAAADLLDQRAAFAVATLATAALLAANPRLPGLELVATGLFLNALAVVANDGAMPVSLTALGRLDTGNAALLHDPLHVAASSHTRLALLTDRIAVPLPAGLGEVLSVGDILLAAGVGLLVWAACRRLAD